MVEHDRPVLSDTNNDHDDDPIPSNAQSSFSNNYLENAYSNYPSSESCWNSWLPNWWRRNRRMAVRASRKHEEERAILMGESGPRSLRRRSKSLESWFLLGGISGLSVLGLLLSANLVLTAITLYWTEDWQIDLGDWGKVGTESEGLSWYPTHFLRDVTPIPCHSHNDYWRKVPLFSALRAGCTGVEADVWLFDEQLYVGHNTASLTLNRTFHALYINPLVHILEAKNPSTSFNNGTHYGVFDTAPEQSLTLLIDFKTSGATTWPSVLSQLQPLRDRGWLTFMRDGKIHPRPVTIVGTGNTPFDLLTANSSYRDVFFDAPLDTMWQGRNGIAGADWPESDDGNPGEVLVEGEGSFEDDPSRDQGQGRSGTRPEDVFNASNSYYASVRFGSSIGYVWRGRLGDRQMRLIREQVRGAHARGLKVRYWNTPTWPIRLRNHVWDVLIKEGADVLNVDDLDAASKLDW